MTTFDLAGAMLLAAALLSVWLIAHWAFQDPAPPRPVRLDDKTTWRRKPSLASRAWPHVIGLCGLGAAVIAAASYAPR